MESWSPLRSHVVDVLFAGVARRARLFTDGWGDEALLEKVTEGTSFFPVPARVSPTWGEPRAHKGVWLRDGTFTSPLPHLTPPVQTAHVRWLSEGSTRGRSACVVLAASREEGFALRERLYTPLVHEGIDLFLLENPYYGVRRPLGQKGGALRTVSDHVLMNLGMVEEARSLLTWLSDEGYERLGIAGYSMGGYMAALTAALFPEPLAVAALAAGASPVPVFTRGLLSWSIAFAELDGARRDAEQARQRLGHIFDLANLTKFPPPPQPGAAILLACRKDGFVPADETRALHAHWKESELRWVNAGHVSAILTERNALCAAVRDSLARVLQTQRG
ncbi:alpha/beta hydrolase family protein [Pyxidicoccus parkwayensis]|uniref:Alpha/beta hydrolase family protein n=1 Tax=Pyxidicoccus parkwayensis TaxID=2813578 RepID=A0ABX7NXY7_9BACT|nr:alpha/beta hydrolase family protein [Pyxidicoccus parkwaysis]QSQ22342.1 alpha/beta hydrolase family protein [Pyxidicoccus parkwaysis]